MELLTALGQFTNTVNEKLDTQLNIEDILNSELGDYIDYGIWLETVKMQEDMNDSVAPNWKLDTQGKQYNYWMAVLDETVEVLNSKHWKWWKNKNKMDDVDWANVQVELIDLFHFILSLCIQHESTSILFAQMVNLEINKKQLPQIKDDKFFENFWDTFLMAVQMKNLSILAVYWCEFWYRAGGDAETLFKEYRIKAALNRIRQEFGYGAQNSYIKQWLDKDTGQYVEDNVIAWKISKDLPLEKNMLETIIKNLREYYIANVAI
jgi:dimeric dUTPase (all-alpha-NTP-PPase superfamily)